MGYHVEKKNSKKHKTYFQSKTYYHDEKKTVYTLHHGYQTTVSGGSPDRKSIGI